MGNRYRWCEIEEEEIKAVRGRAGYDTEEEERDWSDGIARNKAKTAGNAQLKID